MKKYITLVLLLSLINGSAFAQLAGEKLKSNKTRLYKDTLSPLANDSDVVKMPFRNSKLGDIPSFVTSLHANKITSYDHTIWANDVFSGRTFGLLKTQPIRGIGRGIGLEEISGNPYSGHPMVVVDGLPRDIDNLRLSEVKDITVLRDVNSAILYGSGAVNGVILITTKKGRPSENKIDFNVNYGVSQPKLYPEYLGSGDYMTYYNLARKNDGDSPQYSDDNIENYKNGNKYRYPNVDYYSNKYLRKLKSYFDINGQFSGGSEIAQYYINLGWNSQGGLLDIGEGKKARNNRFNVRGNINLDVNDWISTELDARALFGENKHPRGNYWGDAASIRPDRYTPLLPISMISPELEELKEHKNDVNGLYLLGGTSTYDHTPFGDLYSAGSVEQVIRKLSFNNKIHIDLNSWTKGLSFHTNVSFDYFVRYNQSVNDQYAVYEPKWSSTDNTIIGLTKFNKDERAGVQTVGSTYFRRRFGASAHLGYERTFNGLHHFTGTLLGFLSNFKEQGNFQGVKQAHMGLQLGYEYANKYLIDFSGAYINSVKLPKGNRGEFAPTLALAWKLGNEDFLSSSDFVNNLMIRASGGVIKSDFVITQFFLYDSRYTTSGSYSWNEGVRSRSGVKSSWGSNANLKMATRKEVNVGIKGRFLHNLIGAEVNYFHDIYSNLVVRPSTIYPNFYSDFIPYENFEANKYHGIEARLNFSKTFGEWNVFVGTNFLYSTSVRSKVNEVHDFKNLDKQGDVATGRYGLMADGLFQSQDEIDNSVPQEYGSVQPGDIKYVDVNGDGQIDDKDIVYLGTYQPPMTGGLQVKVSYKDLTLYVLAQGESGRSEFKDGDYYWVRGNTKYSNVVRGSWTPENKSTAAYPRLTTSSGNNNFRNSSYWLYSTDQFRIRRVQLTYHLPSQLTDNLGLSAVYLYGDVSNLYMFSKERKILLTNPGGQPSYRTFSLGLNVDF